MKFHLIRFIVFFLTFTGSFSTIGQTTLTVYPDSLQTPLNVNFTPGVFYVPKTATAANDFMNNGIQLNVIRTNVIESALNNSSNLSNCLSLLGTVESDLISLSQKCDKLIFIFEKMPAWLSSSSDGSAAATPGWYVLNTKPPANWNTWQTVVDSITATVVNNFGISNAYFEIWNEPDLGSWTGTKNDYFTLYKRTFDGIKSANPMAKVGGPTVNFWSNNINWQAPYGFISNTTADSSLIGELLDSAVVWNKIPDFISWHQFSLSHQEFGNASSYISQKLASLALPNLELIVSEWNAPSQVRDTELATSYMIKAQLEMAKSTISNNAIAAWQDFSPSTIEFHNDYGLLSYGGIHKPAYNGILLSDELKGTTCKITSLDLFESISTVINDTLFVLVDNYAPPAFLEAINHTLFEGQFNLTQLDSAGYIDIAGNNITHLDSIYRGQITLPGADPMQVAINNSITVYSHYNSIATTPRQFQLNINGYTGNYAGEFTLIDSTTNNMQYRYDSLQAEGFSQSAAISDILTDQVINSSIVAVNSGQFLFSLQPNAVCLIKIYIPGLVGLMNEIVQQDYLTLYPNPTSDKLAVRLRDQDHSGALVQIFSSTGVLVKSQHIEQQDEIDVSSLASGLYYIQLSKRPTSSIKFIKQ